MQSNPRSAETIRPGCVSDLAHFLKHSSEPFLISGGGTRLGFANLAPEPPSRLSTSALNDVLHYEPADLTIAVEAGMTVASVNALLAEHNQVLPIDSPYPEQETLGGLFASGLGGPRRLKYGSLRDWTLGLEVMGPDGVLTKSGGMVVKNVTGYDMPRLHYGMHGSFGVITRLNLKVLPREEASRSIVMTFASAEEAIRAAHVAVATQFEPSSVLVSNDSDWKVCVTCHGREAGIDWQSGSIVEAVEAVVAPVHIAVSDGEGQGLTPFLSISEAQGQTALARISVPASRQLAAIDELSGLSGLTICADPGTGLMYLSSVPTVELREALRTLFPDVVFLSLPDELKHGINVFGPVDSQSMMIYRRLKSEYDPGFRLNPGRFIALD